jgi:23S rRNA-/tRNA-specific pseudouridylate synthase
VSTPIPVLAESAAWIVVDKPSGIATIPARDEDPALSLRHRLEAQLGTPLWVVHRIDRETSGVVAFARDAASHRLLNLAFQRQQVGKQYLAWTAGIPEPAEGSIDVPLIAARKSKMRPAAPGETGALASRTDYALEARGQWQGAPVARVRCRPKSGRQHQIRVHLRSIGCPILRDSLYGLVTFKPPFDGLPLGRLALHAAVLELPRIGAVPATRLEATLPEDLMALDRLVVGVE